MQRIDEFFKNKIHYAVLIGTVIAVLTYFGVKPQSAECNLPAPIEQIEKMEAKQ